MTGGDPYADVARATARLTAPGEPERFVAPLRILDGVSTLISPAAWAAEILALVFDFDPLEEAQRYLAGDWEAYARCAELWANLARFCEDLAANLEAGNRRVGAAWDGHAADAAQAYFDSLAENLQDIKCSLETMHTQYLVTASGVSTTADAVGQLLGQIGDSAATAAICWAAGTALSWTGWGAVSGYAVGACELVRIGELWAEVTRTVNALRWKTDAAYGVLATVGAEVAGGFNEFPLPPAGYTHPAV